jgi:hypothetical protein
MFLSSLSSFLFLCFFHSSCSFIPSHYILVFLLLFVLLRLLLFILVLFPLILFPLLSCSIFFVIVLFLTLIFSFFPFIHSFSSYFEVFIYSFFFIIILSLSFIHSSSINCSLISGSETQKSNAFILDRYK